MHGVSLGEFGHGPLGTRCFVYQNSTVDGHAGEEFKQVGIAQAHTAMGQRHAHGFAVRRAVQIDIATHAVDLAEAVAPGLAAAQPEDAAEYPVASGKLGMQIRRPGLAGPTPATQYSPLRQPLTDLRAHLVKAARGAIGATEFTGAIERGGDGKAQHQTLSGKAVEALVSDGDME
ncbi:hypothetical protein L682_14425 [Aquipseudomonas alcaligenes OT 69]|nr:hypothetical protein L682_14425 [Pseudomonas alcaligenes OT 69]